MWFRQDGAPPHTARETMVMFNAVFPNRLISRSGEFFGRLGLLIQPL